MKRYTQMNIIFLVLSVVLLCFLGIPLLKILLSCDLHSLYLTILDSETYKSIFLSLYAGGISTLFGLIFGIPLAYILSQYDFPYKKFIEGIIDIPIVIPHIAAGIALLYVFGERYLLGKLFANIGIEFTGSIWGIVIAMMFVSVPFLINSVKDGFLSIEPRIISMARVLGASPWYVFWQVLLPLISRNILTGCILMWARGVSEFGAVIILAYHPMTAPVLLYERFASFGLTYAKPTTVILILICLVIFIVLRILTEKHRLTKP